MRKFILFFLLFFSIAQKNFAQSTLANFLLLDTVCVNTPVNITNTSINATTYYWNFCSGSLNSTPAGSNFPSSNLSMPVFMDIVQEGFNYYVFVCNHTGSLSRMNFGNSLLNMPVITDLGSFGGIIPWQVEGIEIQKDGNNWIGYIIGGQYANSRLVKLNFGTSVANIPTVTNLGNIGGLDYPVDFTLIKDGTNWFGFTVSADNNTVTRYSFGNSLNNTPLAANLGNIGGLNYPVGLFLLKDINNYHLFITNRNSNSISRLDFGTSVANTATGINLGNPGNNFNWPRDITVIKDCDKTFGFVTNEGTNAITRLDFNNNILSIPTATNIGNIGNLNFPSSISEIFRTGDAVNFFAPNVNSNSVSRITFNNCNSSSIPSYSGATPPAFQYNQPGEYNVSLFVDDGLPTQSVLCKKIVVLDSPPFDFEYKINSCNPLSVEFTGVGNITLNSFWSFGDGNTISGITNTTHTYLSPGSYVVKYTMGNLFCPDTVTKTINIAITNENIILTPDTIICAGSLKQLRTSPSLDFCWTPIAYLDDPNSPNPVTSTPNNITYFFTAQTTGTNVIVNGDFSQGNTGFTSTYQYLPGSGVNAGVYNVGSNILAWHPTMTPCNDHTTGTGNMMMVNGAENPGVTVWSQTITVQPNTNYAFSAWLQHITIINPASLQFSINGISVGDIFHANNTSCLWERFYTVWNSGNTSSAVISIINQNQLQWGNDFALDDISFAPIFIKRDSVIITVENPLVKTSDDATVCAGDPVQLNTTGAATYLWTPATGLSNTGIANPVATPDVTTEYSVTGTTMNGCTAKDTVNITAYSKPVISKSDDITICNNASVQLFASGGITYTWTPPATLDNPSTSNPIASPANNTTYYVTVSNANCSNNDSIKVNVKPEPVFMVSSPAPVCKDQSIQLDASGGDIYSWDHPADLNNPAVSNPIAYPQNTTTYSVLITDTVCDNSASLSTIITILPLPTITASKLNDIDCTSGFSQLNATGGTYYEWTPSAGLNNNLIYNPTASPQATTVYSVKGTDNNGCINYDSLVIEVSAANKSGYYMPTAFTPNNDGLNDCYGIKYWGVIESLEFSIYNRWGERIFFTKNPNTCWDGIYKGTMQDIGVYVYMIKAKGLCGDTFKKGLFTLVR